MNIVYLASPIEENKLAQNNNIAIPMICIPSSYSLEDTKKINIGNNNNNNNNIDS